MNLKTILDTASYVVAVVGPMIRAVAPGSDKAIKIAEILESAQSVLRFGNTLVDEKLPELAEAFKDIRAEVDALAAAGDGVPADRWDENEVKINDSVARARRAMGLA